MTNQEIQAIKEEALALSEVPGRSPEYVEAMLRIVSDLDRQEQ